MPLFPEHVIQEVAAKNDIYDVVSQYVTLKKTGGSYVGLCPFHNEKTPSFSVSPQRGIFHCFGCGVGGTVITFLMKIENLSFTEAVQELAKRANISLPEPKGYDREAAQARERERNLLMEINREAAQHFYESVKDSKQAVEYLKARGLTGADAKRFWLGYAKDSWDDLFNYLKAKGYTEGDINRAGLLASNDNGRVYDRFRNRIMFPIFDTRNQIIGFGGRVLDDSKPKYLNSPESVLFSKSRNLFSLNIALASRRDTVLLVEGYMDVIALAKAGYPNTVATLGTALTAEQAGMLKRYFKEVVLCYDSDGAGQTATERAIGILRDAGVGASVLTLDGGKDPDEYIKKYGIDRFNVRFRERKADMAYLIGQFGEKYDLTNTQERVAYVSALIPFFIKIANDVELDVYVRMLSERAHVSAEAIYSQLGKDRKTQVRQTEKQGPSPEALQRKWTSDVLDRARDTLLGLLIASKGIYLRHKEELSADLFGEEGGRARLFEAVTTAYQAGETIDEKALCLRFADEENNPASRVLSQENRFDDAEKAFGELTNTIHAQLREKKIKRALESGDLEELNQLLKGV